MPNNQTKMFQIGTPAKAIASISLIAVLAGCAGPVGVSSLMKSEPTFVRLNEERAFAQSLRQRYLELATNAYDRGDYERSDFYSLRAIMAVEGKLVAPAQVTGGVDPEITNIRHRLQTALMKGMRLNAPDLAARAQAAYDCWLLEGQAGDQMIAQACRNNAFQAVAELESVGVGTRIASVTEPQQFVVNSSTPSQTYNAGGTGIEIINQQPPVQHRQALARTRVDEAELVRSQASRAYAEGPRPTYVPRETVAPMPEPFIPQPYVQQQIDLPTEQQSYEPVDLGPINLVPQQESQRVIETVPLVQSLPLQENLGGQYAVVEGTIPMVELGGTSSFTSMQPIYDAEEAPRVAALDQGSIFTDTPVFSGEIIESNVSLIEDSGDVISALVATRQSSGSDASVFFGFDSDEITPEGEDVLIDVVEKLILEDRQTVSLMGFTDSAGDSRYNQLLAMRRSNAVRQYIQEKTDRTINFELMPVGEAEAVQNGGDGVIEALNRRVEIIIR